VLFFPAQMALSQRPASTQDGQSGSGFYQITTENFVGMETFGVYGDCGRDKDNKQDFSLVAEKDCVFSVDSIRIDLSRQDLKQFIKTICVDKISLDATNTRNCFETVTDTLFDVSAGIGPSVKFGPCVGISVAATTVLCAKAGVDWSFGASYPIRAHEPVPLRDIEFLPVGGMILHDTGIGSIQAKKFVTVSFIIHLTAAIPDKKITITGEKPAKMDIILGYTSTSDKTTQCFDLDGNDLDELDMMDNNNGCANFKVQADKGETNFGEILKVACLVGDGCGGGALVGDILKGSSVSSAGSKLEPQGSLQAAAFSGPDPNNPTAPFIDVDLTSSEMDEIAIILGDESTSIVDTANKFVDEVLTLDDALCEVLPDLAKCPKTAGFGKSSNGGKSIEDEILDALKEEVENVNFDNLISDFLPKETSLRQLFEDLDAFVASFDIAPAGFSAVELAKRFGDIGEDITTLDTKVDSVAGDIKGDINEVIGDINKFIINPLIDPKNVIDVDIKPLSINIWPSGVRLTNTEVAGVKVVSGVELTTTTKNFDIPQPPVIEVFKLFKDTLNITPIKPID